MRLLHYLEIENFKRFGDKQRIELEHPAVLIGPNNCGKTTAIQALTLWSQAVKTWFDARKESSAKERTATSINRLNIVAVPVQRTRFFWHNTQVRTGNKDIPMTITVGVVYQGQVLAVPMRFRNQGDELIYCTPNEDTANQLDLIEHAAKIKVNLLYPMSGLQTIEPLLQPNFIDGLLGQGQTAQVLRNLCLMVYRQSQDDWRRVADLMRRLFNVELAPPGENSQGHLELHYRQSGVKEMLDVSSSGRGFQQMLLIFAYLYSHKGSVLLVDEPDAHLEILRQKQVYVLLRDIASENQCQVVVVTHSEVILEEALDKNLTLLIDGKADDLAKKSDIKSSLKHFGADHYIKARERGYVLYVEGGTDVDMLRALAHKLSHPVAAIWDERINTFYVQNNHPDQSLNAELERVEGGFGITPQQHFNGLRRLLPELRGLAILDADDREPRDTQDVQLTVSHWRRYEAENYFITPEVLRAYVLFCYRKQDELADTQSGDLFNGLHQDIDHVMDELILDRVFERASADFQVWKKASHDVARVLWEAKTTRLKLSDFAEEFFRRLARQLGQQMLLTKGELHHLVEFVDPQTIAFEVREKLDLLQALFESAN